METLRDVFAGGFPPAVYGKTPEEIEATVGQAIERVFRDEDGMLRSGVNGRTMEPLTVEEVKDRPDGKGGYAEHSSVPNWVKPLWMNYENAGQASGVYLEALCAKAQVTKDPAAHEAARRTVEAILTLWENAAATTHPSGGGGRGWFPKPYAGIRDVGEMHECSADQYCDITLGLHRYYRQLASAEEKRKIEEVVCSFAQWWYEHDYCGVYFGQAIWWKRLHEHSMATAFFLYLNALAYSWNPGRKFREGFDLWIELTDKLFPAEPVWVCMNGVTLGCLERLLDLRADMGDFWRKAAAHQARLLAACVEKRTGFNVRQQIGGYAAHYLAIAGQLTGEEKYFALARDCLRACTRREDFYAYVRGQDVAALTSKENGDDCRDVFWCELHVHWLAGYWKMQLCGRETT
jgi:hypothetical protein